MGGNPLGKQKNSPVSLLKGRQAVARTGFVLFLED
jgi:hypothetical protein